MTIPTDRESAAQSQLQQYSDPILGTDLWSSGCIDKFSVDADSVNLEVELPFPAQLYGAVVKRELTQLLRGLSWVRQANITVRWKITAPPRQRDFPALQAVKNIVAVASGKGGVGKSTTAANLALALAAEGATVGVLDADIYGPSQPRMLGIPGERPTTKDGKSLQPPLAHGMKVMSIGLLIDEEQPMVWRGPMVSQALNQLLDSQWQALDYLIVDMPPGTGDIQLTLAQRVPVSGAVIVTTPQDIALLDARKGLKMFQKVDVPVLGIVENMSTHICSKCGHEEHVFGSGGGKRMAEQYGLDVLAELPLHIRIREQADSGNPTVSAEPESALGQAYLNLGRRVAAKLSKLAESGGAGVPQIVIEHS